MCCDSALDFSVMFLLVFLRVHAYYSLLYAAIFNVFILWLSLLVCKNCMEIDYLKSTRIHMYQTGLDLAWTLQMLLFISIYIFVLLW